MKTTNQLIADLKQHRVIIIEEHDKHILPDLTFALSCLCIDHTKRVVETKRSAQATKIKLA